MSLANPAPRRPRRGLTPWLAGGAALLAIAALLWAVLGGGRDGEGGRAGLPSGARRVATIGAVEATALPPALDPGPAGVLGGAGSAVLDEPQPTEAAVGERPTRPRRAARPRAAQPRPSQPSYRTIGPQAGAQPDAPPPSPST